MTMVQNSIHILKGTGLVGTFKWVKYLAYKLYFCTMKQHKHNEHKAEPSKAKDSKRAEEGRQLL